MSMELECDPEKSNANKTRHGIDLHEAKALREEETTVILEGRRLQ